MAQGLPLLISVPHGGSEVPPVLRPVTTLSRRDIFFDGDSCAREIYSFESEVAAHIEASVARAIVDLNRAPDDRPPANPDGVVKTVTTDNTHIYANGSLDQAAITALLDEYYFPYHEAIAAALRDGPPAMAFDCHTMLERPPAWSADTVPRPLICLSNGGDRHGRRRDRPITCNADTLQALARVFRTVFQTNEVALNAPFTGGYTITHHAASSPVPWVQIELNRCLYLCDPYFDADRLRVDPARLGELRDLMLAVLRTCSDEGIF